MRTITDAAKIVGLSRRVIQEYEKDGVAIKPSQKNKYGYLIYDDTTIDRLWQIRFYRELGYDKRAIKAVFDDPDYDYTAALEAQVKLLEKKKLEIENLIGVANVAWRLCINYYGKYKLNRGELLWAVVQKEVQQKNSLLRC